jgi:hypothetical protein
MPQVLFPGYRIVPPAEISRRLFPLQLMDTRLTELTSEDRMACEMPNNPIRLANSNSGETPCEPISAGFGSNYELMTEAEVIHFLRIPEISNSKDYHNVIEHLKKFRGLPRLHICRKALYPKKAILEWVEKETDVGK